MDAFQSTPHPALRNYIAQYLFLSLADPAELGKLKQMFFPFDIAALAFFSKELTIDAKICVNTKSSAVYTGLITTPSSLTFTENEAVNGFIVVFKPFGFSDLFRINTSDATDYFPDFFSIKRKEGRALYEQIMDAESFGEKKRITDNYFFKKIPRHDNSCQIRAACNQIMMNNGVVNIKELAYATNLSLSSLERQFTKKIDVSPKLFARFKRFHYAVSLMNSSKPLSFSQVAYQSGFYDPAHLNKEFEAFTGQTPSSFSSRRFPLYQQLILDRNYYTFKK